jgi:hypothetical protein
MQSHVREQNQNQADDDPTFTGWQYENGATLEDYCDGRDSRYSVKEVATTAGDRQLTL